jgi:hypothetical protein
MVKSLVALLLGAGVNVSIAPGSVKVEGPLAVADATASIQKQLASISACVPETLPKDVTVTLKLTVMSDGQVARSSVSGGGVSNDPAVNGRFSECVGDAADAWKFPAGKGAGVSEVRVGVSLKRPAP